MVKRNTVIGNCKCIDTTVANTIIEMAENEISDIQNLEKQCVEISGNACEFADDMSNHYVRIIEDIQYTNKC